jgi:outer membrane protein
MRKNQGTHLMRKILALTLAWLAGGILHTVSGQATTEEVQHLDLQTVFDMVEKENFTVLINREAVENAFQQSMARRSFMYPSVDLNAGQSRGRSVSSNTGNASISNQFSAALVANYQILNANLIADYQVAKVGHRISQLSYESILQQIMNDAGSLYFQHMRNLRRLDVIHANIERDRSLLDLAKNQLAVGVATQIDVTRAESRLANDQIDLLRQQQAIRQSELQLKRLLNLKPNVQIRLSGWEEPNGQPVVKEDLGMMSKILENRYDYKVEQEQVEQARLTRKAADWQRIPALNIFGQYGMSSGYLFDGKEKEIWSAGVSLTMPIFEGFRIRSERLQADAYIRQRQYQMEDRENQIRTDYQLAVTQLNTSYDQIALVRKQVDLAQQELQLARNRFEQGVADNREVTDAQAALAAANDQLVEAIYQYNLNRLNYATVQGNPRGILSE